jgi:hypothetical protein
MFSRRFDGRLAGRVPAYRRIMPFVMRGRNESAVYFEKTLDLGQALPWLDDQNRAPGPPMTIFHVVLGALVRVLDERPRLNRFVSGRRIYQRDGIWLSFAVKKRLDDHAAMTVVKRRFEPGQPLHAMVAGLARDVGDARSHRPSSVEREIDLLLRLPRFAVDRVVRLAALLDACNLAPRALVEPDPMYTSVFVANLGSIGLDAAYHHLYEHGNCPLFMTIGAIHRAPVVTGGGELAVRRVMNMKCTFDERIEDGLYCARSLELLQGYIERPATWA